MQKLFNELADQCSRKVTRIYSTSFSMAVKMLSPKIQGDIHAVYGFVRLADEIVDTFLEYDKEILLNEFETNLWKSIDRKISLNPVLHSFQDVVHKYSIDIDLIKAFLKSMRADLHKLDYHTHEGYEDYIYGSADVVGLMCLKIFVNGNKTRFNELKTPAMKLGSAFQKVNFLRDIKDDSELLNRSYFPHLNGNELAEETKATIIQEIENDFAEAYEGIIRLPAEAKFGVYTAYVYYRRLLNKLKKTNTEQLKAKRVRISNPMKMFLLIRSFFSYKLNLL